MLKILGKYISEAKYQADLGTVMSFDPFSAIHKV